MIKKILAVVFVFFCAACSREAADAPQDFGGFSQAAVHDDLWLQAREEAAEVARAESFPKDRFYRQRLHQTLRRLSGRYPSDFSCFQAQGRLLASVKGEEASAELAYRRALALAPDFADKYRVALDFYRHLPQAAARDEVKKSTREWLERLIMMAESREIPQKRFEDILSLYRETRQLMEQYQDSMDTGTEMKMKILLSREPYTQYYKSYQQRQKEFELQSGNIPVVLK